MIKKVTWIAVLVSILSTCGLLAADEAAAPLYVDTGCYQTNESHGCIDNGSSIMCWQNATYERYGMPQQIPLPIEVVAHAECQYVHLWAEWCDDHDARWGSGEVSAQARCYINPVFAGSCFDDWCYCSCSES